MADKKHAELIRAWLDGSDIQVLIRFINKDEWHDCDSPTWAADKVFRIKPTPPAKQYPVTAMTQGEIMRAHKEAGYCTDAGFCNAVLRHAIDNGQVAPLDAYQQCAADLLKAEEKIRNLKEKSRMRDVAIIRTTIDHTRDCNREGVLPSAADILRLLGE